MEGRNEKDRIVAWWGLDPRRSGVVFKQRYCRYERTEEEK